MTNLEEQIQIAENALLNMKEELKQSKKLELTANAYKIWGDGSFIENFNTSDYTEVGATRATKKLAEIASKNMVIRNKLEAYAMQIDPEWRDEIGIRSYYIYINHNNHYDYSYSTHTRSMGTVFMPEEIAIKICGALNNGDITL